MGYWVCSWSQGTRRMSAVGFCMTWSYGYFLFKLGLMLATSVYTFCFSQIYYMLRSFTYAAHYTQWLRDAKTLNARAVVQSDFLFSKLTAVWFSTIFQQILMSRGFQTKTFREIS